jgi:hypothetical protein
MPSSAANAPSRRQVLVAEIRERLSAETFPRFIVLIMLLAAGGVAFLGSVAALDAGLEPMVLRYPLAAASGYVAFLLLIRVWIALRRGWSAADSGLEEAIDPSFVGVLPRPGTPAPLVEAASHGVDWSFDVDDLWWLVVALLAALAGVVALAMVIHAAPVLLAEVALDAALVGTVYGRLRQEERGYWAATALRHTWAPAAMLVVFTGVLGFALQQLAPDALSIGDVLRRVVAR